jgi:hypothetical protein
MKHSPLNKVMEALNRILRAQAISHGLCKQWTEEWDLVGDMEELVDKYKRGLDFCIEHDYPSNAFIKEHFDADFLQENHIYVDADVSVLEGPSDVYVVQGESVVDLHFKDYVVATVWVRHASHANIFVSCNARVFVHVYDKSNCFVNQFGESRVFVKKHSEESKVTTCGKITYKEKKTSE